MINTNIDKQYRQQDQLLQDLSTSRTFCRLVLLWQRGFVWENVFVCCVRVSLAWKTISCPTEEEIEQNICKFGRGTVWMMSELRKSTFKSFNCLCAIVSKVMFFLLPCFGNYCFSQFREYIATISSFHGVFIVLNVLKLTLVRILLASFCSLWFPEGC